MNLYIYLKKHIKVKKYINVYTCIIMSKYEKSKIYKIVSNCNSELVYYGSTYTTLSRRLSNHKGKYKSYSQFISLQDYVVWLHFGFKNEKMEIWKIM